MIFTPHLLVYVCAWGITVACRRMGRLRLLGQFNADEAGRHAFAAALNEFRESPVSVMVDGVDEDYRLDALPHVIGSARREMLERRLRQVGRNALFAAAWPQGRDATERRDDRYLFIILSNHDAVRPWLDMLRQHGVHLAELTVLPAISHALLRQFQLAEPHLLLVSEQSGGLRLSYFQRGELRFSRLTAPENLADGHAPDIANEIAKTDLYLNSQRLMPRDAQLTVCLLDRDNAYAALCREIHADSGLACRSLGSAELSRTLGVAEALLHSSPDIAHLALLGRKPAAVNLAPAAYTRGYAHLRLRRGIYGAAMAVLVGALAISGHLFYQHNALEQERVVTETRIQQQWARYRAVAGTFPHAPTSPQNLRRAVETARALYAAPTPMPDFVRVSQALEVVPEIAVLRLRWLDHDAPDTPTSADATSKNPTANLRALYLDGEVTPFQGDYQAALASIERLVAILRRDPGVTAVNVLALPINADPAATLDETQRSDNSAASARFRLKLLLRPTQ